MADVFLSYSRQDKTRAAQFVELLESQGWDVFWDQETRAGTIWPKVLEDELNRARCLIVLWTAAAVTSRWVRIEAYEALQNDKLLPVRLEAVKPPMEFRQTQTYDLIGWTGEREDPRLPHLIADLSALTKLDPRNRSAAASAPATVSPAVPASPVGDERSLTPPTQSVPEFTADRAPTYSGDARATVPTLAPNAPATARAHESPAGPVAHDELPAAHDESPSEASGPSAIETRPERRVATRAVAATDESSWNTVRPRLWWGLGLAVAALVVVWISRTVFIPGSEQPSADLKSPVIAPLQEKSPNPAVVEATPAPQASPPVPSPVAEPAPRAAVKAQRVVPARCLEIADRFQTTGQLTEEERRFLSSKECAR
jgi:TIR domain